MNSGLFSLNGNSESSVRPEWQKQLEGWREQLDKCGHKPSRKRVHALRVATLRLQAQAEYWMKERVAEDLTVRATRRWYKQADKLREALSPARDADVYLQMLKGMRGEDAGTVGDKCLSGSEFLREIDKLERRLKEKRASAEKKVVSAIEKRRERLEATSKQMQEGFAESNVQGGIDASKAIGALIVGLIADVSTLNADTLHEFRGRAKAARYLAELSSKQDLRAKRQAMLLKKMQNAAGAWHDWQMLAIKGEHYLGTSKKSGLVQLLETLAFRSLEQALGECRNVTAQLNELQRGAAPLRQETQKKAVRSVDEAVSLSELQSA